MPQAQFPKWQMPNPRLTGRRAETHVEHDNASHERSSIGRREEAEAGEDESDGHHDGDLSAVADQHRQKHPLLRRPEDVAVDQLPPELLLRILGVHLVVTSNVFVESSQQNHRHLLVLF